MMQSEYSMKFNTTLCTKKLAYEWEIKGWNAVAKLKELKTHTFKLPEVNKACFLKIIAYNLDTCRYLLEMYVDPFEQSQHCWVNFSVIPNGDEKKTDSQHELGKYKSLYYSHITINNPKDNSVNILCEIFYIVSTACVIEKPYKQTRVCNNLIALYNNKKLFDVTILVGTETFQAHSTALASISNYFLCMFENENFIESRNRLVDLTKDVDITVENFNGFLEYIYGNKNIEELDSIVSELLILADKFDVKLLHEACELFISKNISQENVIKLLIFSDKYRCQILKKEAIIFAKNNIDFIKTSDEFNNLFKYVDIVRELL